MTCTMSCCSHLLDVVLFCQKQYLRRQPNLTLSGWLMCQADGNRRLQLAIALRHRWKL